uniref:Uncharacterized protein n=1 Tax=Helianthus annuus TaxID=4232 RepID=A0A251SNX7_HELAN
MIYLQLLLFNLRCTLHHVFLLPCQFSADVICNDVKFVQVYKPLSWACVVGHYD